MKVPDLQRRGVTRLERHYMTLTNHTSYVVSLLMSERIPVTYVTGYPKSGTVWMTQMVADYLQLPFVDLTYTPVGCPAVMHAHYRIRRNSRKFIYVVRDGRDTMVSMYFYLARHIPAGDNPKVPRHLSKFFPVMKNKANVRHNLPSFIERQFKRPAGCKVNWKTHVDSYLRNGKGRVPLIRYESMLSKPNEHLSKVMSDFLGTPSDEELIDFTVRKYDFEKQTGRKRGTGESSAFVRKGNSGEWQQYFNKEAAEIFDKWAGQTLIDINYEADRSWISDKISE